MPVTSREVCIGVDFGTSGCRAVAVSRDGATVAEARLALPPPQRPRPGWSQQEPGIWREALYRLLRDLTGRLDGRRPQALAIDGTSATLLAVAPDGTPAAPALMYDDSRGGRIIESLSSRIPISAPARSAGSSLAKALWLQTEADLPVGHRFLHQSEWLTGCLLGRFDQGDENNALKLGYDPAARRWPGWLAQTGVDPERLPRISPPGTALGPIDPAAATQLGLPGGLLLVAGTTDSTAAVIATGVGSPGEAVTSLGSTLVVKVISEHPVEAPEHGVYSHRLGDLWLAGGASNSGGAVLREFFDAGRLEALSRQIDPERPSGLDYYPLVRPGERFPRNDPALAPRLTPRPESDVRFLHGLLEGMARIERDGYELLRRLGAPAPVRVLTTGGGAANPAWRRIRERLMGVPVKAAGHQEPAIGAARLAWRGVVPA